MAEPVTPSALALTAGGVAVFGIATGLQPHLLIAGLAGGLWALFYAEPQPIIRRVLGAIMSPLVAAWVSPTVVYAISDSIWPQAVSRESALLPASLVVGFLAMAVIGPGLLLLSRKRFEDAVK